jgi:hypothetical protein
MFPLFQFLGLGAKLRIVLGLALLIAPALAAQAQTDDSGTISAIPVFTMGVGFITTFAPISVL